MSIVLSMKSSRNVEEVAIFLKKQLQKTQEAVFDNLGTKTICNGNTWPFPDLILLYI